MYKRGTWVSFWICRIEIPFIVRMIVWRILLKSYFGLCVLLMLLLLLSCKFICVYLTLIYTYLKEERHYHFGILHASYAPWIVSIQCIRHDIIVIICNNNVTVYFIHYIPCHCCQNLSLSRIVLSSGFNVRFIYKYRNYSTRDHW